jgi:hypothetical protein
MNRHHRPIRSIRRVSASLAIDETGWSDGDLNARRLNNSAHTEVQRKFGDDKLIETHAFVLRFPRQGGVE